MEISVLHLAGCPNVALAHQRIAAAAARLGVAPVVRDVLIETEQQAAALGFAGSPTVLVDGRDVASQPDAGPRLACRLYATPSGNEGAPSVKVLVAAMTP